MTSTAAMLEESILATQQQKSAADQVDSAIQQIREAAEQLAAGQTQRAAMAERLEALVADLDNVLQNGRGDGDGRAGPDQTRAAQRGDAGPLPGAGSGR
jgi:ABC-type transporter Mla subunit MlaD